MYNKETIGLMETTQIIKKGIQYNLTIEIIKGQIETIKGIDNIVETLYCEGIEEGILNDGNTIIVHDNGTYEIINK